MSFNIVSLICNSYQAEVFFHRDFRQEIISGSMQSRVCVLTTILYKLLGLVLSFAWVVNQCEFIWCPWFVPATKLT